MLFGQTFGNSLTDSDIATTLDEIEEKLGHARVALETKSYIMIQADLGQIQGKIS